MAFLKRKDFCYIMRKIVRSCKNQFQQKSLESWCQKKIYKDFTCENFVEVYETNEFCDNKGYPNQYVIAKYPEIAKVVIEYTRENIAYIKFFIEEPFYTKSSRDVGLTGMAFVGNTGGLISLCLGLSFISVFEMLYHSLRGILGN